MSTAIMGLGSGDEDHTTTTTSRDIDHEHDKIASITTNYYSDNNDN
jgi:hypothetical protein